MKLTNQEIINMGNTLFSLQDKEMPITLTYKIVNNLELITEAYQIFEKTKQKAKTEEELQELLGIEKEVELEAIEKDELIEAGISLSPIQLVGLKRLING